MYSACISNVVEESGEIAGVFMLISQRMLCGRRWLIEGMGGGECGPAARGFVRVCGVML